MLIMATFWTFTGCDIERFPYTDLSADEVKKDPEASLDALLNGAYA